MLFHQHLDEFLGLVQLVFGSTPRGEEMDCDEIQPWREHLEPERRLEHVDGKVKRDLQPLWVAADNISHEDSCCHPSYKHTYLVFDVDLSPFVSLRNIERPPIRHLVRGLIDPFPELRDELLLQNIGMQIGMHQK